MSGSLGPICILYLILVGSSFEQLLSHLIFQIICCLTCKVLNREYFRCSCGVCSPCWIQEGSVFTIKNTDISAYSSIREIAIHQRPLFTLILEILTKLSYSGTFTCLEETYSLLIVGT